MREYLTPEQVYTLNEKHGWFQYGDAQSDVSKAFAQDAIAMHERIRLLAPDMLRELQAAYDVICAEVADGECTAIAESMRALIAKAKGQP